MFFSAAQNYGTPTDAGYNLHASYFENWIFSCRCRYGTQTGNNSSFPSFNIAEVRLEEANLSLYLVIFIFFR
jgi:hypothetical protein